MPALEMLSYVTLTPALSHPWPGRQGREGFRLFAVKIHPLTLALSPLGWRGDYFRAWG
jgi:hypothetical protein